jgi:ATP-dependent helicase/nuclease subunit A
MYEGRLPFEDEDVGVTTDAATPVGGSGALLTERAPAPLSLVDADARRHAVDPMQNIVLEASAGTGKTRVLVERYVSLLRAGVEPDHILAVTFTRKAAAEMRQRIIDRLKEASRLGEFDAGRWREVKERLGDIAISTIDAFCLTLLREFPLEADVDPGFDLAADTDVPRLIDESLDRTFRICRAVASEDDDVALVFAQLGERRLRAGMAALLDRRLVAPQALQRFLQNGPRDLTAARACVLAAARLGDLFASVRDGVDRFLDDGPVRHPQFAMLADDMRRLVSGGHVASIPSPDPTSERLDIAPSVAASARLATARAAVRLGDAPEARKPQSREDQAALRALVDRLRAYFLTQDGKPRGEKFAGTGFAAIDCRTEDAWRRHRATAADIAPAVADAIRAFRRDLNVVLARGVWRIFAVALQQYQRTLDGHALLDFPGVLERAIGLLRDLDEFAESRLRLETRHRHVLVDEFQDTSRAQWELVLQLIRSWGEGVGAAADAIPPSIFVVGDRKQSIYGFRDADVSVIDDAATFIEGLRPGSRPRHAITVSFRSAPQILAFVNDLFGAIVDESPARTDGFRYDERDRFPVKLQVGLETDAAAPEVRAWMDQTADAPLGIVVADTVAATADCVGDEIARLLSGAMVRDRATGVAREARPADVAVLFRSRDSHREFESALDRRGIPTYVYKGLGFFEADEIQDAVALLRYLADPLSNLRAGALLRSRIVRLSDGAIALLGRDLALTIVGPDPPGVTAFNDEDRLVLDRIRSAAPRWLAWVDRLRPSELLDAVMRESAYAYELRGPRFRQARENLKKLRAMIRRAENRGYQTLGRIANHLERLAVGDESNATIDAVDAVSLMTVHAAKGLEFPIVFVVNIGRGTGGARAPIRVSAGVGHPPGDASVAIADYQSEADEDTQAREREETRRLLYVALTRARDRLYLSATAQDGKCRMGRGSLGEVLPANVRSLFDTAAKEGGREPVSLSWSAGGGSMHIFHAAARCQEPRVLARSLSTARTDDFDRLG